MAWAPDYVTVAEQKAFKKIANSNDDAEIVLYNTAASRAVDHYCNRQFGQVAAPEARVYTAFYDRRRRVWVVEVDDLPTTVGLAVEVNGVTTTDYTLEPRNAALKGKPWTHIVFGGTACPTGAVDEVEVTASWGWAAVPNAVKLATRLQASRFGIRRESPYGIAGSPQTGSELRLLARLDPDVAVSLDAYVRWWGAV
jgi:hypothetical protein